MKEQILQLRKEGKTYLQICEIVGCSKSTVSFHCGDGQKEKSKIRKRKNNNNTKYKIFSKIDSFLCRTQINRMRYLKRTDQHEELYDYIVSHPYCYLTGEKIDLDDSRSYNLDHIIPYSKGGKNTLENMGLCLRKVNQSKSDMSVEELIEVCKKILIHNGYKIEKI